MITPAQLTAYCDDLLTTDAYQDYCPNGLQVEGRPEVRKVVSGVTASQALIDAAVADRADLLLVHHGFFWRGEDPRVVGMKRARLRALLANDINLVAYHLPLDGHSELGNNVLLGRQLGWVAEGRFGPGPQGGIALFGTLPEPQSAEQLARQVARCLGREPLLVPGSERPIRRVGWCSGGAQGYIEQAAALGLDAFLSGEVSEPTVHVAREMGIHYLAAGHHATERYGVAALGEHLAGRFGLQHRFVDIDNPA